MKLTDYLVPENIQYGIIASSKKRALELIGKQIADYLNQQNSLTEENAICPVNCFESLFKREKLGSTAINNGVALPHAKLNYSAHILKQPIAVFFKLEQPIDFEANDHKEVDLIYALLFPEQNCECYKDSLSHIAERLSDKNLLKHLRTATSAEEIWQVFNYSDQREHNRHLEND
ncbi:PTS sugar transporter subunit IIA [Pasteurellaceae bacterium Macca]|nr:PTS sugar transporter subunit IIA [Pasteurellaceae bacterium Macca]